MLWKTHIRICDEAFRRLGITLSNEVYESFREAIVLPDKQRREYEEHHSGKSAEIMENLTKARGYFLQGNLPYAFFHLGIALHYIQDSYVSVISYDSPNNHIWHQNYEQNIEDASFVYDVESTIKYLFDDDSYQLNKYSELAQKLSGKAEGKDSTLRAATLAGVHPSHKTGKPKVDLNLALKASLIVTESILSSKTSPALETQLKGVLEQHEALLRNAEIETSNNVIRLIQERDQLISKKVPPTGMSSKIKNWITGIRISLKNRSAISKSNNYFSKKHLEKVANNYVVATNRLVASSFGWYNFQIPPINIGIVERELLLNQEIAEHFDVTIDSINEVLKKCNVLCCCVANKEIVKRSELNRVLFNFPINGFREYPA